jgi:hypothetical protein
LEAATGFEPVIKVLQTFALPLGHAALLSFLNLYYQKAGYIFAHSNSWIGKLGLNGQPLG